MVGSCLPSRHFATAPHFALSRRVWRITFPADLQPSVAAISGVETRARAGWASRRLAAGGNYSENATSRHRLRTVLTPRRNAAAGCLVDAQVRSEEIVEKLRQPGLDMIHSAAV